MGSLRSLRKNFGGKKSCFGKRSPYKFNEDLVIVCYDVSIECLKCTYLDMCAATHMLSLISRKFGEVING
jgi:hypothetical protein